jgi:hypothetical protein
MPEMFGSQKGCRCRMYYSQCPVRSDCAGENNFGFGVIAKNPTAEPWALGIVGKRVTKMMLYESAHRAYRSSFTEEQAG